MNTCYVAIEYLWKTIKRGPNQWYGSGGENKTATVVSGSG